jgi:hypothetical protein
MMCFKALDVVLNSVREFRSERFLSPEKVIASSEQAFKKPREENYLEEAVLVREPTEFDEEVK